MADRMEMIGRKWRVTSNVLVVVVVRMEKKKVLEADWEAVVLLGPYIVRRKWRCCSVCTSSGQQYFISTDKNLA
jgi:hypothetical protein